ncbi:tRNA uridine-5-carboxymethylaminomethyl(34) synthesis GTPase MnmE [Henriciella mobilis]|uniref:tRNA modification GTPase MnmE n=1 Tax=Henriciella mobilis TaxID=2305467 RepID=A0A399RG76_9PROT|nr:tRNA uridine-5-carboxymethylaminomethyl(34) synthesis GTPase MnmE [Henriciella mobilis]RIJ30368.1 tRNA uridine-5-carboxymethylaminomethyl(34) synthesis GTPase MnmE [Henriciella mobilis]
MTAARDTICALASGPPPSAIAIIRISGPGVRVICNQLLVPGWTAPRKAVYGRIRDRSGEVIDEGLAVFMPGPASYTGEDTAELYLHGGAAVIEHALDAICSFEDTRLAEAGEFTRRAFENGRLDLVEAEGVADLIDAETRAQKHLALDQLDGRLSRQYEVWRSSLLNALALLEVSIDFPDEDDAPDETREPVARTLREMEASLEKALADDSVGERIRDGFHIAIVGPPNAGKSSLLNKLARREAAIVSDIPGTTRDVVEVRLKIGGQIAWVADTAGLREAADVIEAEGVRRAQQRATSADLRIQVRAADDRTDFSECGEDDLLVVNKIDLAGENAKWPDSVMVISAITGDGIRELERRIADIIRAKAGSVGAPLITRRRHRLALESALFHVKQASDLITRGGGAELVAEDVRLASRQLSGLIGEIGVEEILGAVFSSFCIGK